MMPAAASSLLRWLVAGLAGIAFMLGSASVTLADMRREGSWPADDQELVSFSAVGLPRAEAIHRLADQVGWSVVVDSPSAGNVDVRVTKQPAARVLEILLGSGDFVARRQGLLVSIAPRPVDAPTPALLGAATAAPAIASPAPASSAATLGARARGRDRVVTGRSVVIKSDEVVKDLAIFGGSAEVYGRVTGDATVFGGSLTLEPGGHVEGDLNTFGGSVHLKDGARLDGDVTSLGGSVTRDSKALVGKADEDSASDADEDDADDKDARGDGGARHDPISFGSVAAKVGSAITRTALLFAFGVILWALSNRRIDALQNEVAARPMRAFAMGSVGLIAALAFVVALCVTLVGIPLALFGISVAIFGAYAGVCAVLSAAGAALLRHKTSSPYVHLGVGCVLYLLLSSIPFVGTFVTVIVVLVGFGALVATRAAGFVPKNGAASGG